MTLVPGTQELRARDDERHVGVRVGGGGVDDGEFTGLREGDRIIRVTEATRSLIQTEVDVQPTTVKLWGFVLRLLLMQPSER